MNVLRTVSPPTPRTARGVGHPLFGFINKEQEEGPSYFGKCWATRPRTDRIGRVYLKDLVPFPLTMQKIRLQEHCQLPARHPSLRRHGLCIQTSSILEQGSIIGTEGSGLGACRQVLDIKCSRTVGIGT
jgi:hypothetical protein